MRHLHGEIDGRCRDCMVDRRAGHDLPVCSHAEPADAPNDDFCAWCGHEVTR